jgi:hypothetical protein
MAVEVKISRKVFNALMPKSALLSMATAELMDEVFTLVGPYVSNDESGKARNASLEVESEHMNQIRIQYVNSKGKMVLIPARGLLGIPVFTGGAGVQAVYDKDKSTVVDLSAVLTEKHTDEENFSLPEKFKVISCEVKKWKNNPKKDEHPAAHYKAFQDAVDEENKKAATESRRVDIMNVYRNFTLMSSLSEDSSVLSPQHLSSEPLKSIVIALLPV